jgi:hypothetical protein
MLEHFNTTVASEASIHSAAYDVVSHSRLVLSKLAYLNEVAKPDAKIDLHWLHMILAKAEELMAATNPYRAK